MSLQGYKVLVVDDEPKILKVATKMLTPEGYQVLTTADVEEALDILEDNGPISVVVSDNRMPTMRGTEFFKKMKTLCPDTVRILMTAHYDAQLTEDVVNTGEVYRYLKKPLDFNLVKRYILEGIDQYERNLEKIALGDDLQHLNEEKSQLEEETKQRDRAIVKLQWVKRMLVMAIFMVFCCIGLFYGYTVWDDKQRLKSNQVVLGDWMKYENGTAMDNRTAKMWMTMDFRNVEGRQPHNWEEAMAWADKMNRKRYGGFSDWRVPTITEYEEIYDTAATKVAYDGNEKFKVGYPAAFEDGGGYGFWSKNVVGLKSAKFFFFVGGYSKSENKGYHNPTVSVRLVRN